MGNPEPGARFAAQQSWSEPGEVSSHRSVSPAGSTNSCAVLADRHERGAMSAPGADRRLIIKRGEWPGPDRTAWDRAGTWIEIFWLFPAPRQVKCRSISSAARLFILASIQVKATMTPQVQSRHCHACSLFPGATKNGISIQRGPALRIGVASHPRILSLDTIARGEARTNPPVRNIFDHNGAPN
jgi:hypothetical protein